MRQSLGIVKGMVYFPKSGYEKPFAQALGHPEFNDFLFRRAGGCLRHSAAGCSLQRVRATQGSTPFKTNSIAKSDLAIALKLHKKRWKKTAAEPLPPDVLDFLEIGEAELTEEVD